MAFEKYKPWGLAFNSEFCLISKLKRQRKYYKKKKESTILLQFERTYK